MANENKASLFGRMMATVGLAEIEKNTEIAQEQPQEAVTPESSVSSSTGAVTGMVDQNMRKQLLQAVADDQEQNPLMRGIDAFEYAKGLKIAQGATLQARAKSAFDQANAFATSPLTKSHLKKTLGVVMAVLEQEADGFENHLNTMIAQEVGPQEVELKALEKSNSDIDAQVEALKAQKQENLSRINELSGDIHTKRRNLDQTAANFQATLEDVISEYQEVSQAIEALPDDATAEA